MAFERPKYWCKECKKPFKSAGGLMGHQRFTHDPKVRAERDRRKGSRHECTECDRSFPSHEALGGHMGGHRRKRQRKARRHFQCGCGRVFAGNAISAHKRVCRKSYQQIARKKYKDLVAQSTLEQVPVAESFERAEDGAVMQTAMDNLQELRDRIAKTDAEIAALQDRRRVMTDKFRTIVDAAKEATALIDNMDLES